MHWTTIEVQWNQASELQPPLYNDYMLFIPITYSVYELTPEMWPTQLLVGQNRGRGFTVDMSGPTTIGRLYDSGTNFFLVTHVAYMHFFTQCVHV